MKSMYLDTSVLMAANKPDDLDYESSKRILSSDVHKVTSYIALAELISVVSRLLSTNKLR